MRLLFVSLSLPLVLACSPAPLCNLVGCHSIVVITLPEPQESVFAVAVSGPGLTGSFDCVPPASADAAWFATSYAGDLRGAGPAIAMARCAADEVIIDFLEREPELPPSLTVTVTVDGSAAISQTFDTIGYATYQPNGPDCPPTCSSATLALVADDG